MKCVACGEAFTTLNRIRHDGRCRVCARNDGYDNGPSGQMAPLKEPELSPETAWFESFIQVFSAFYFRHSDTKDNWDRATLTKMREMLQNRRTQLKKVAKGE